MKGIAANYVLSRPWAILPAEIETLLSIADRTNETPEAVASRIGRPLDNTQEVVMHGDVAVLPIRGPISRYATMFSAISGATSLSILATDFRAALDNPEVKAIVLEIDSPGGEAAGIGEFASQVREGGKVKPVTAYVSSMGASAALWIATAADRVVVSPQGVMGSMGVVWPVSRKSETDKARSIEFVSSQSPNKRPDVETPEGKAQMQGVVDAMAESFVEDVARYRGIEPAAAIERFGRGGLKVGKHAVAAGMADRVGSLESVIAGFAGNHKPLERKFTQVNTGQMSRERPESIESADIAAIASEGEIVTGNPESSEVSNVANLGEIKVGLAADTTEFDASINASVASAKAQLDALNVEIRKGRLSLYGNSAEAFLMLAGDKVVPAERVNLKAALVAAMVIDNESPIEGYSALAGVKAGIESRRPHGLTEETISGDAEIAAHLAATGSKILPNAAGSPEEAAAAAEARELREMLESTESGRAVLAEQAAK